MKLLVDTNVLLDVLGRREPHVAGASALWSRVERCIHDGCISAISFNNVYFILRRSAGREPARQALKLLRDTFRILPLDERTIHQAIDADIRDFEDAVQFFSAVHAQADCIITRNVRHFPPEPIPAMTPDEFLAADSD